MVEAVQASTSRALCKLQHAPQDGGSTAAERREALVNNESAIARRGTSIETRRPSAQASPVFAFSCLAAPPWLAPWWRGTIRLGYGRHCQEELPQQQAAVARPPAAAGPPPSQQQPASTAAAAMTMHEPPASMQRSEAYSCT
jgi:hypothetical protein